MVSFFAALNTATDTQPRLRIYQDWFLDSEGVAFASLETSSSPGIPRIAQFGTNRTLYAFVRGGVYRTNDGGFNWTLVFSPAVDFDAASNRKFGPVVLNIDNTPYLCIGWGGAGTNFRLAKSPDGVNWETGPVISLSSSALTLGAMAIFNNMVYGVANAFASSRVYYFDFQSLTGGNSSIIADITSPGMDFVIHNSNLYVASYKNTGTRGPMLHQVIGNNLVSTVTPSVDTLLDVNSVNAAWSSNNRIYFAIRSSTSGLRLFRTDTGLTAFSEVTSTAVPSALQTNTAATVNRVLIDPNNLAGEQQYLYSRRDTGNTWDIYYWNYSTERLVALYGNVGSTNHAISFIKSIQGTSFYEFSQAHAQIVELEETLEGVKIYFRLYGVNGATQSASFSVFYADDALALGVDNPATLVSPSVGTVAGNTISGLVADGGATLYNVTWALRSNGFPVNTKYKIVGRINVNTARRRRRRRKRWYRF